MYISPRWRERTLNALHDIHNKLLDEERSLKCKIQRCSHDHEYARAKDLGVKLNCIRQHLDDLERIIPIRHIYERRVA